MASGVMSPTKQKEAIDHIQETVNDIVDNMEAFKMELRNLKAVANMGNGSDYSADDALGSRIKDLVAEALDGRNQDGENVVAMSKLLELDKMVTALTGEVFGLGWSSDDEAAKPKERAGPQPQSQRSSDANVTTADAQGKKDGCVGSLKNRVTALEGAQERLRDEMSQVHQEIEDVMLLGPFSKSAADERRENDASSRPSRENGVRSSRPVREPVSPLSLQRRDSFTTKHQSRQHLPKSPPLVSTSSASRYGSGYSRYTEQSTHGADATVDTLRSISPTRKSPHRGLTNPTPSPLSQRPADPNTVVHRSPPKSPRLNEASLASPSVSYLRRNGAATDAGKVSPKAYSTYGAEPYSRSSVLDASSIRATGNYPSSRVGTPQPGPTSTTGSFIPSRGTGYIGSTHGYRQYMQSPHDDAHRVAKSLRGRYTPTHIGSGTPRTSRTVYPSSMDSTTGYGTGYASTSEVDDVMLGLLE